MRRTVFKNRAAAWRARRLQRKQEALSTHCTYPHCMISQALPEKILLTGEGGKKGNHCSSNQYVLFSIRFIHERGPMARRLPPLNGLKAFEAAGRSESFTRAGEELNVTQAVSHQVKALQEILNIRLFKRERQRLCLTEPGREYLLVVRDAFDRIASRTERLAHRRGSSVLTVSTSPDFAAKWLVNRLGRFAENHPEIDLRVSATTTTSISSREDVDVAVHHGIGNWPGMNVTWLCPSISSRSAARNWLADANASRRRSTC
jgi:hypothetical protein